MLTDDGLLRRQSMVLLTRSDDALGQVRHALAAEVAEWDLDELLEATRTADQRVGWQLELQERERKLREQLVVRYVYAELMHDNPHPMQELAELIKQKSEHASVDRRPALHGLGALFDEVVADRLAEYTLEQLDEMASLWRELAYPLTQPQLQPESPDQRRAVLYMAVSVMEGHRHDVSQWRGTLSTQQRAGLRRHNPEPESLWADVRDILAKPEPLPMRRRTNAVNRLFRNSYIRGWLAAEQGVFDRLQEHGLFDEQEILEVGESLASATRQAWPWVELAQRVRASGDHERAGRYWDNAVRRAVFLPAEDELALDVAEALLEADHTGRARELLAEWQPSGEQLQARHDHLLARLEDMRENEQDTP